MTYGISNSYNSFSNYGIYQALNSYQKYTSASSVANSSLSKYQSALKGQYSGAITETRDLATDLQKSAKNLMSVTRGDVFEKRTATSTNEAAIKGTVQDGAYDKTYEITVSQLAEAQQNVGTALTSDDIGTIGAGKQSFSITSGKKTYDLAIDVKAGETNQEILTKMAKAINDSRSGVSAKVVSDQKGNTSQLEITGAKTGIGNEFSLADKAGSDLIAKTGSSKINVMTQDAIYTVDRSQRTSASNEIELQNGKVDLVLQEETTEPIKVQIGQDNKAAQKAITAFVDDYNKLVSSLQENTGLVNKSLLSNLQRSVQDKSYNLKKMGITVGADQQLQIDDKKLSQALTDDPETVQKTITGYNGLADKVENTAKGIIRSPISKLTESNSSVINEFTFKNEQYKYYQQQMNQANLLNQFNRFFGTGSNGFFFDSYF